MLNDYIKNQEDNLTAKEQADSNLNQLNFRINGSKTIDEIKKEVDIFLEKNSVPLNIAEGLKKLCDEFTNDTDVNQAIVYLEEYMKKNLYDKEKEYQQSSDTVKDIKEEVVEEIKKDLDDIGITLTGNSDQLIESIQEERDVYKLKDNVERTTEYFENRKQLLEVDNKNLVEVSTEEVTKILEMPNDENLLDTVLEYEENEMDNNTSQQVEINDDGSIVLEGDAKNLESMNFAAMMTSSLVANDDLGINQKLDMKFIKEQEHNSTFKIIYGDFPLQNVLDDKNKSIITSKINELTNSYQSQVSYMDILGSKSPELKTALTLIQEHVLNEKGAFQMAIKNGGNNHEIMFALDENYAHISDSFYESGAMVTHDAMEHSVIRVNNTTPGEQLLILSTTVDSLKQRKIEERDNKLVDKNVYQKKLEYPNIVKDETANVNKFFLIVVLVTQILLLLVGTYFVLA